MKTTSRFFLIFLLLSSFHAYFLNGQNTDLIGLVDNKLVKIDNLTGATQILTTINNMASGDHINLSYHRQKNTLYTILDSYNNPKLVSISMDGEYQIIGPLTFNGSPIPLLDALAYNSERNKLYGGASLNGGTSQNDFYAESIIEIDPLTGVCTLVSTITTNLTPSDIDVMAFEGDILYIFDGNPPGSDVLYFYKLDFNNIGPTSFPQIIYQKNYINIEDFVVSNNNIYFTESRNLRKYNINNGTLNIVGSTHSSSEYNGRLIRGISNVPSCLPPVVSLGEDIVSCIDNPVTLEAATCEGCTYTWNDGSTANTFNVSVSGEYWVDVENQCGVNRDNIIVTMEAPIVINLGEDRIICNESIIVLDTTNFNGALFEWQDGSTQTTFLAAESGSYWVRANNSCGLSIDTVEIVIESLPYINLGNDKIFCSDEPIVLDVTCVDCVYKWNNGSSEPIVTINESGFYYVEVENICGKSEDSLNLHFMADKPFIPNLFTPNGDAWNQFFEVDNSLLGSSLKVYNRWGKPVYESSNYLNNWDANNIVSGIYYYYIVDKFCKRKFKGSITIIH